MRRGTRHPRKRRSPALRDPWEFVPEMPRSIFVPWFAEALPSRRSVTYAEAHGDERRTFSRPTGRQRPPSCVKAYLITTFLSGGEAGSSRRGFSRRFYWRIVEEQP